jgi:hypothetical protein
MKSILVSSLAAFLFINNAMASETISNEAAIKAALTASLSSAIAQIDTKDTLNLVSNQLDKQMLTLHTNQIIVEAQSGLPTNQFKVVIAD